MPKPRKLLPGPCKTCPYYWECPFCEPEHECATSQHYVWKPMSRLENLVISVFEFFGLPHWVQRDTPEFRNSKQLKQFEG